MKIRVAMACAGIAVMSFFGGMKYQKNYLTPIPCVQNYADGFGYYIQSMLRDTKTIWESGATNRDIALDVIHYGKTPEDRASVYVYEAGKTKIEYYVPSYCYVEERLFQPILWKKP
jgi:hypothetical protein